MVANSEIVKALRRSESQVGVNGEHLTPDDIKVFVDDANWAGNVGKYGAGDSRVPLDVPVMAADISKPMQQLLAQRAVSRGAGRLL